MKNILSIVVVFLSMAVVQSMEIMREITGTAGMKNILNNVVFSALHLYIVAHVDFRSVYKPRLLESRYTCSINSKVSYCLGDMGVEMCMKNNTWVTTVLFKYTSVYSIHIASAIYKRYMNMNTKG